MTVEDSDRGLMLCASRPIEPPTAPVRVVDDSGLNRLAPLGTSRAAAWISVRAADTR